MTSLQIPLPPLPAVGERIRVVHRCVDGTLEVRRYAEVRSVLRVAGADLTVSRAGQTITRAVAGVTAVLAHLGPRPLHRDGRGWFAYTEEPTHG